MSGTLRLRGSTSGYSELQAPAVAADQTFVLPTAGGTLLTTDSPVPKLTLELGSASQPSLTFQGDTDTGLFSEGTNTLNLVTGGSSKVVLGAAAHTIYAGTGATVRAIDIDSSGNIGIGQSNPSGKLEVNGGYVTLRSGASSFPDGISAPVIYGSIGGGSGTFDQTGNLVLQTRSDAGNYSICMVTGDTPTERLRINSSGNVGIGTTSPGSLLDLEFANSRMRFEQESGSNRPVIRGTRTSDKANRAISIGGSDISFLIGSTSTAALTSADEKVRIDSSGRVGIGTSSPSDLLHVRVNASGDQSVLRLSNANATQGNTVGINFAPANDIVSVAIKAIAEDSHNAVAERDGALGFFTRLNGGSVTEKMRIDSSGRVGFGVSTMAGGAGSPTIIRNSALRWADSDGTQRADIYGDASSNLVFRNGTSSTERMRIDSSGNIGIGDTNPDRKLQVINSTDALMRLGRSDASSHGSTDVEIKFSKNYYSNAVFEAASHRFEIQGTEKVRIDSSGRLLVGTSSSLLQGEIIQGAGSNESLGMLRFRNDGAGPEANFYKTRATTNAHGLVSNNDAIGTLNFRGSDGSSYIRCALIEAAIDGTPGANDMPGRLVFSTTADGASSPTERMRISSNGLTTCTFFASENYVIVGTEQGGTTVNAAIDRATNGNGTNAVFIGTSQIQVTSDIRLKHNIANTELNATEKIKQIEIFDFDWNDPRDNEWKNCRGRWTGFSAQQVQPILPFCINAPRDEETREILEDDPSDWVVDPTGFIPVLVKALQEANAKIETLEQRLSDAGIA